MNRNRHITLRVTQEEYNLIKAHCGKNLSRFIVSRLFKGMAEDVRPPTVEIGTIDSAKMDGYSSMYRSKT
jgi:hypothetical protein